MKNFIGLDGHSTTSTLVSVDQKGKILARTCVQTTEKHLLGFIRGLVGERHLVVEESNLSQWFYALLQPEVDELIVCNPRYLSKKPGAKTDFKDACHLADELRCGHVVAVYHESSKLMELRALVAAYQDVVKDTTRAKNRYKALLRSNMVPTRGRIYGDMDRLKLLDAKTDRFIAEALQSQIKVLEESKKEYLAQYRQAIKAQPAVRRLTSLPGIDLIRALTIGAVVCSPWRFKNKHKFWAYSKLARNKRISDGKTYGFMAATGRNQLKEVFMGAALSALRGDSELRAYYDAQREGGRDDRKARRALARKIAAICLAILKNGSKYDPNHEKKKRRADTSRNTGKQRS